MRQRAQNTLEYALVAATIAIAAIAGLNALQGAEGAYFTGMQQTLQPTPIPCGTSCTALRSYQTTISPCPTSVMVFSTVSCTVTITDTSASPQVPTGSMLWTSNGPGAFGTIPCLLTQVGTNSANCTKTYRPTGTGQQILTATSDQTPLLPGMSATWPILVTKRTVNVVVNCTPNPVTTGIVTSCDVSVADASGGVGLPPATGTVSWNASGPGSPTSGTCTLGNPTAGHCTFLYTPSSSGVQTLTVTYNGDTVYSSGSPSTPPTLTVAAPVSIAPASVSVVAGTSQTFTASGGVSPYTFNVSTNGSGSPTGPSSGTTYLYTAGSTASSTDKITVTDSAGATAIGTVTVTKRGTQTVIVNCSPALGAANSSTYNTATNKYSPTTCSATVTDTTGANPSLYPTGTVTWSISGSGNGTFSGSPCTLIFTGTTGVSACQTSVTFTPVSAGPTTIQAAYNGDSTYNTSSGTVSVLTAPGQPQAFQAKKDTGGSAKGVNVSWSAPANTGGSSVTGYNIYRSTSSGAETLLTTVSNTTTTYHDTATTTNVTYFYYVTAVNSLGQGQPTAESSATAA